MLFAICYMLYAICYMLYAIRYMLYAILDPYVAEHPITRGDKYRQQEYDILRHIALAFHRVCKVDQSLPHNLNILNIQNMQNINNAIKSSIKR